MSVQKIETTITTETVASTKVISTTTSTTTLMPTPGADRSHLKRLRAASATVLVFVFTALVANRVLDPIVGHRATIQVLRLVIESLRK